MRQGGRLQDNGQRPDNDIATRACDSRQRRRDVDTAQSIDGALNSIERYHL